MRFSVFQISRKGGRDKNEDRVGYSYTRNSGLFAVADGMGGHPEGEVAAQLALQTIAGRFQREARPRIDDPHAFLQEAIIAGHHQLQRYGERKAMKDTPRTTIVACVLQDHDAWWAHCGDSRLYLIREGRLFVRTRDHSMAELEQAKPVGMRSERFNRNVLFTCLGSPGIPVVDFAGPIAMQPNDRLLLCSDGLWGTVGELRLVQGMSEDTIDQALPRLVDQALRNGGSRSDNVTALAIEWEAADGPGGDTVGGDSSFDSEATIPRSCASDSRLSST